MSNEMGKYLALILRHKPEVIGITLDEHGWAEVSELIEGIRKSDAFDRGQLEELVAKDKKQRYSFNEDKTKIRANQGHSIPVDVELKKAIPPKLLYHGTAVKYEAAIDKQGLRSKSRLYVHLSEDLNTAESVGRRHGSPVIYQILAEKMQKAGYEFFLSANGVWLTKCVPVEFFGKKFVPEIFSQ